MQSKNVFAAARCAVLFFVATLLATGSALGQAVPYRGLWVGSVALQAVNEVTIPLDADNVPIAPNPQVPTPTHDQAYLRLILHVNGAGQVNLLKDVAVLNRLAVDDPANAPDVFARETDLALVTDPRIYPDFPPQPAIRIASAAFDFGDAKATEAIDVMVEVAAQMATAFATNAHLVLNTEADRLAARQAAIALIEPKLETMATNADVSEAFSAFLLPFNSSALNAIAANPSDPSIAGFIDDATAIRDASFYGDSRARDMVNAVVVGVNAAPAAERQAVAHRTASAFADVLNLYQRFISGKTVGDMIVAAAAEAGVAALVPGATAGTIENALRTLPESITALAEALTARVMMYDDTRATDAIDTVLAAMAEAAFLNSALSAADVEVASEAAGRTALADMVARYPLPVLTPTVDYNAFVTSASFGGIPATAAEAAARAAIEERHSNILFTELSVYAAARIAAVNALRAPYGEAARAMRTALPLQGEFGPGIGDPRAIMGLAQPSDLGAPALTGRIYLPANHPTNPFRHRRHPDHTTGFNIERVIRIDFDGAPGDALTPAGYGVDQITGTYREEVFGLHKPLGPEPDTNPIGLRTEGPFQLNRISSIDTLNTR